MGRWCRMIAGITNVIGWIVCILFHNREAEWNSEERRYQPRCPRTSHH